MTNALLLSVDAGTTVQRRSERVTSGGGEKNIVPPDLRFTPLTIIFS
jgi:hypothetical protein